MIVVLPNINILEINWDALTAIGTLALSVVTVF